jgi:hypothetical protein
MGTQASLNNLAVLKGENIQPNVGLNCGGAYTRGG